MRSINERNAEALPRRERDRGGIGEMRMDHLRAERRVESGAIPRDEGRQLRCERFLLQVAPFARRDAFDGDARKDRFRGNLVHHAETRIVEPPGDEGDTIGRCLDRLCGRCGENIRNMPARIGSNAVAYGWASQTSAERNMIDPHDCPTMGGSIRRRMDVPLQYNH